MPEGLKNAIRGFFDPIFTQIVVSAGYRIQQNIPLALQRAALAETTEYVRSHMAGVPSFRNPRALLLAAAQHSRRVEGLVLEFGVWKGETLRLLAKTIDQTAYGFDSFQGLPEDWRSGMHAGVFALKRPPRVPANAELVIGWFDQTLQPFLANHPGPIKLLHIDCDLYSSTVTVLSRCVDRLQIGSVIVFDEYFNYAGWQEGEFRAFQEVIAARHIGYRYLGYARADEQVALEITTVPSDLGNRIDMPAE